MRSAKVFSYIILACILLGMTLTGSLGSAEKSLFTIEDYFNVASLELSDMTKDGEWLVGQVSTGRDAIPRDNYRFGDPTYIYPNLSDTIIINVKTGKQRKLFSSKQQVQSLIWSPSGEMLAFFIRRGDDFHLSIWHRKTGKFEEHDLSKYGPVATRSQLTWSPDGKRIFLAIRDLEWTKKSRELFNYATKGPIIVQDSDKPFLLWDEIGQREGLQIPAFWDRDKKTLTKLLPETPIASSWVSKDGTFIVFERDVTEKTTYEFIFGTSNQLEILPISGGPPRVLLKKYEQRTFVWNKEITMLAYTEKGDVFVMQVNDEKPRRLTGEEEKSEKSKEGAEKNKSGEKGEKPQEKKEFFSSVRFSPDGGKLLCSCSPSPPKEEEYRMTAPPLQYWLIDVKTAERKMIYESKEDAETRPMLGVQDWSPDGRTIYFSYSAQDKYDRGLVKLDLQTQKMSDFIRSAHIYQGFRMSEDGQTFVFSDSDGDRPGEWYVANPDFSQIKKFTDLNPQLEDKALSHTELISYRDADGKRLYGVLYYPANYEKGKKYPLVTEVYENFFDNGFSPDLNILTSAGYAVLHPSVQFETGYPREAWIKGALAGINKAIEMGFADLDRLGIQGTSYGGYATVLIIAQTDRFKAAINNSGKVDMVSFYTQSPRIGVRNIHAPERSQDRIGGTMWEHPERYLAHSAILFADRIKTPLLCITGDQDPNVEAVQSQEIYYALRRLGKKVVWVTYHNGSHGGPNTIEERKDMYKRMIDWYDKYLKAEKKPTQQ